MRMRTLAPFTLVIMAAAHLALAQSLAEIAEKEKERRKNNDKEATVVVKNRGVWLVPEATKSKSDSKKESATKSDSKMADSKSTQAKDSGASECSVARETLDELERNQRVMNTRYLQMRRRAQAARILDSHGQRELEPEDWKVSEAEAREILGEMKAIGAGLNDTNQRIETYLQRVAENCQ